MNQMDNYVQIMLDSLAKKSVILDRLIAANETQGKLLSDKANFDDVNWDQFNIIVLEKEAEINRINEMDEGFQSLFDRVKVQLNEDKDKYASKIKQMQSLITELEQKSIKIRTGEEKNRMAIETLTAGRKQEIKKVRTSLKVASSYYQTMQKSFLFDSSSIDTSK